MTPLKTFGCALLAFVIVAIAGLSLLPSKTAHAQIDISGEWNLEFNSAVGVTACTAAISQTGSTFDIDVECLGIGNGSLAGDISPETGVFTASGAITGIALEIEGVASAAGDVIEGTWNSDLLGLGGTLVGTFKGPPETPAPLPTIAEVVQSSDIYLPQQIGPGRWRLQLPPRTIRRSGQANEHGARAPQDRARRALLLRSRLFRARGRPMCSTGNTR